jgi:Aldo/keto reductase family
MGSPKAEAQKVYETYREAGGNFIDTANSYTNGASEKFLGEFMQDHRDSVVLATKYSNAAPGNDPNAAGNHRKSMMLAVEASLKRLQTEYIRTEAYCEYAAGGDGVVEQGPADKRIAGTREPANSGWEPKGASCGPVGVRAMLGK